ncbi:MAG: alcohol dehydrogenase catalytic domain-containing protein [Actinomycetota bacterium]|nr:alcohol dehydrogenase catalytic domain-containing protein [Actinomycetota bacterium]
MQTFPLAATEQPKMRAAVLHDAGDLRIEDVPIPDPGPGELLLAVETVGICGTDASEFSLGPKLFPLKERHPATGHLGPLIVGHEFSGRVLGMGSDVDGFSEGDLVASAGSTGCGDCDFCRSGRTSRCDEYWAVGLHRDGALAEYCTVPATACVAVGTQMTPDAAALAQPMSIAVHALRRGRVEGGEDVLVIGAGGIGAFVTYAASVLGCNVTSVDLDQDRLDIATALGARRAVLAGPESDLNELDAAVGFEITGTEAGMRTAITGLGPGGRLIAVGFQKHPLEMDLAELTSLEQEWIGTNRIDASTDLPEAIRLLVARNDPWNDIAPLVLPLDQVEGALRSMADGNQGPIKTLISPGTIDSRPSEM